LIPPLNKRATLLLLLALILIFKTTMKELEESLANSFHLKVNILRFISQTLKKYKKRLLRTEWIYSPQLKEQK